jgi:hypothetical protein
VTCRHREGQCSSSHLRCCCHQDWPSPARTENLNQRRQAVDLSAAWICSRRQPSSQHSTRFQRQPTNWLL